MELVAACCNFVDGGCPFLVADRTRNDGPLVKGHGTASLGEVLRLQWGDGCPSGVARYVGKEHRERERKRDRRPDFKMSRTSE